MFHAAGNTLGRLYSYLYGALSLFSRAGLTTAALWAACVVALLAGPAGAADYTWFGGGTNANWGNATNWGNGLIPPTNGVNTNVFMRGPGGLSSLRDLFGTSTDWHINSLTFDSTTTDKWQIAGGRLRIDSFITNNSIHKHEVRNFVELGTQNVTIRAVDGDIEFWSSSIFSGRVHFTQNNSILTVNGGKSVMFGDFTREAFITNAQVTIDEGTLARIVNDASGVTRWNVLDGTLRLGSFPNASPSLGAGTIVDVAAGGTFDVNGFDATIGLLTGSGSVVLGPGGLGGFGHLTLGASSNFTFGGTITGSGHITKIGSGRWTLTNANAYTTGSTIRVEEGRLRLGVGAGINGLVRLADGTTFELNGNSVHMTAVYASGLDGGAVNGTGAVDLQGGTLTLDWGEIPGNVQGPGTLVKTSFGAPLWLHGTSNTFTTLQILDQGIVDINNPGALGSANVLIGNATLRTSDTFTSNRPLTLTSSGSTIEVISGTAFTQNGVMSGSGGLNKAGDGVLILGPGANNTYSGQTRVNSGVLELGASNRIPDASHVTIGSADSDWAMFHVRNFSETVASISSLGTGFRYLLIDSGGQLTVNAASGTHTFAGEILSFGGGTLNKQGGHTLVLTGDNFDHTGPTNITGGTLRGRLGLSSLVTVGVGATWDLDAQSHDIGAIAGGGAINIAGASLALTEDSSATHTFSGNISGVGGLTKRGSHTLVLSGNNSYLTTVISEGVLRVSSSNNLGTGALVFDGGTLHTTGSFTISNNVPISSLAFFDVDASTTLTLTGTVSGAAGSLVKHGGGTLVLSGNNMFGGELFLQDGVLSVAASNHLGAASVPIIFFGGTLRTTASFENERSVTFGPNASGTFDVDAGTTLMQSGTISGDATSTLIKDGGGMLVLTANNTFSGELVLQDGMLSVSASNHLGDGSVPIIFFGGTLRTTATFENSRSVTIGPSHSGTFYVAGPTTLTQSGTISGGSDTTLIKDGGGVLRLVGDLDASFSGAVTINDNALELFHNASASFGGNIGGDGSLRKGGTGVYTLSGNLTYGGETRVEAGTLRRDGGSGLPNTTDLYVAAGAVYDLNNQSDTINALTGAGSVALGANFLVAKTLTIGSAGGSGTFSGVISGTLGHLAKTGAGTQVLTGNNTYAQTFFNGGVLSTTASANLGSGQLNFQGGTWEVTGTFSNSRAISIVGASSGTIDVQSGETLTQTGNISGIQVTLNKTGAGTLVLSGSTSLLNMNVNAGVLRFSGGSGLATSTNVTVASGATWDLNGVDDVVGRIAGAGAIQLNGGSELTVGGNTGSTTFSGEISGTGGLVKAGGHQLTVSGTNTYSGGTAINGGVLAISSNANLGTAAAPLSFDGGTLRTSGSFATSRNVTLNAGGGTIDVTGGSHLNIDGSLSGAGGLTKIGSGTLALNGNATGYAGPINVTNGSLLVSANFSSAPITVDAAGILGGAGSVGAVVNEGQVSPGNRPAAAGRLDVAGDFTQGARSTLDIELGGIQSGIDYDQLAIDGNATLDGTLAVSLIDRFAPRGGDLFEILTAGRLIGTFAEEVLPALSGGLAWNVLYGAESVVLEVAAAALPGDYNQNGVVDAADYTVWRDTLGHKGANLPADGNGNSVIDPGDYDIWKNNFGQGSGSAASLHAAVPEPCTLLLACLSLCLPLAGGGRRSSSRRAILT